MTVLFLYKALLQSQAEASNKGKKTQKLRLNKIAIISFSPLAWNLKNVVLTSVTQAVAMETIKHGAQTILKAFRSVTVLSDILLHGLKY